MAIKNQFKLISRMKKLILICSLLLAVTQTKATHLMGGDIRVIFDTLQNTYVIKVTHYRDMNGVPASTTLQCTFNQFNLAGTALLTNSATTLQPDYAAGFGVQMLGIPYPVEVYNYYAPIGYMFNNLGNGKYSFYVTECCRNQAILNMAIPVSESLTLTCDYMYDSTNLAGNGNPVCLAEPIIFGPINQTWTYNPFPFDIDGDSLSWQLNTPYSDMPNIVTLDTCIGYTLPTGSAANPFMLNATNGEITWEPTATGNYVASFKVSEYRNGNYMGSSLRDMQYIVIPDTSNGGGGNKLPQFTSVTPYQTNTTENIKYIYYYPGTPFEFDIFGEDVNLNQTLSMKAISNLIGVDSVATFASVATGTNNQIKGTFKWTPKLTDEKDQKVVFRLQDGTFSNDLTLIMKKSLVPLGVKNVANNAAYSVYPNPSANGAFTISVANNASYVVTINDVQGKTVYTQQAKANNGLINIQSTLQAGMYTVQIASEGQALQHLKLMVR
jgi:Secretion system C-terminal sorting domain